jgi:hypothetical protein
MKRRQTGNEKIVHETMRLGFVIQATQPFAEPNCKMLLKKVNLHLEHVVGKVP